jgi:hypothetical protein
MNDLKIPASWPRPPALVKADYSVRIFGAIFVLEESGEGCSITNDAENVIDDLASRWDISGCRVIYKDRMGTWDELRVKRGRFAGFRLLNAPSLKAAFRAVMQPETPPAPSAARRPRRGPTIRRR